MKKQASKTKKIRNWKEYNQSLVNRGDIMLWIPDDILHRWKHENKFPGQGRPYTYSDTAVEILLTIREVFQLPYRNTEGFGRTIFTQMLGLALSIPDYSTLCRRAKQLEVEITLRKKKGHLDLIVDSTGLKVFGEGEWKVKKHGWVKHRTWRKLHLAIDAETQEIVAELLTENSCGDSEAVEPLLQQCKNPVDKFYGDGAYDPWRVRKTLAERGIEQIIPPRKDAVIKRHGNSNLPKLERDEAIREIRKCGRKNWKKRIGYHRRSLGETAMFRMKSAFGSRLKNRKIENQKTEARIRCKIINRFTKLGMPAYSQ